MRVSHLVSILAIAGLAVAGCSSSSGPSETAAAPALSRSFQPAAAVRCDRERKICEYDGVASVGLTLVYFGDKAAQKLIDPPAAPEPAEPGQPAAPAPPAIETADPIFKPEPTQSCDTLVATCYDGDGANVGLTREQFGGPAAKRLETRMASREARTRILKQGPYITCDNLSGVCYDRLGAGVGLTQLYLGDEQSQRLLQRLGGS